MILHRYFNLKTFNKLIILSLIILVYSFYRFSYRLSNYNLYKDGVIQANFRDKDKNSKASTDNKQLSNLPFNLIKNYNSTELSSYTNDQKLDKKYSTCPTPQISNLVDQKITIFNQNNMQILLNSSMVESLEKLNDCKIACDIYEIKQSYRDDKSNKVLIGKLNGFLKECGVQNNQKYLFSKCWCDKSKFYYQLHYNFRVKISKQPIHPNEKVKKTTKPFNLVITGIDSLSHAHAIRKLPKTYNFFKSSKNSILFNRYNILGKNTQPNLFPFLTGNKMTRFPEFFLNKKTSTNITADDLPIIFYDYNFNNYTTVFYEDLPNYALFNFLTHGFKKTPTDYYSRPVVLSEAFKHLSKLRGNLGGTDSELCLGSQQKIKVMLKEWGEKFLDQKISRQKELQPLFAFLYTSEYSHTDLNQASILDEYFYQFFGKYFGKNSGNSPDSDHDNDTIRVIEDSTE